MIDPNNVPAVDDNETLARYVVAGESTDSLRKYVRADDTAKPQLFQPYPHIDLSVNRHRECDEMEIWRFGRAVAAARPGKLHGRCDIEANACRVESLNVVAKPILNAVNGAPDNPNHADIEGFPPAKEDQKSLALKLAAKASKRLPL